MPFQDLDLLLKAFITRQIPTFGLHICLVLIYSHLTSILIESICFLIVRFAQCKVSLQLLFVQEIWLFQLD